MVRAGGPELDDVAARDKVLREIAQASGGSYAFEELDDVAIRSSREVRVGRQQSVEILVGAAAAAPRRRAARARVGAAPPSRPLVARRSGSSGARARSSLRVRSAQPRERAASRAARARSADAAVRGSLPAEASSEASPATAPAPPRRTLPDATLHSRRPSLLRPQLLARLRRAVTLEGGAARSGRCRRSR